MFWLSITNSSPELAAIAAHTRPWAILKAFWQFSQAYGEYQSLPPSRRRQFILEQEQQENAHALPESCL
jgi:hypothetical protein